MRFRRAAAGMAKGRQAVFEKCKQALWLGQAMALKSIIQKECFVYAYSMRLRKAIA
jgi:hypothetical protein